MLSLDFVRANREAVERAITDKNVDLDLDAMLTLDAEVRSGKSEIDRLRAERNAAQCALQGCGAGGEGGAWAAGEGGRGARLRP